jgi:hypothetical protein
VTVIAASLDHVAGDFQAFMDLLATWCHEAAAASPDPAAASCAKLPLPPSPTWDRAPLVALQPLSGGASSDDGDGSSESEAASPPASSRSGRAGMTTSASAYSMASWGTSLFAGDGADSYDGSFSELRHHKSRLNKFWQGPPVWQVRRRGGRGRRRAGGGGGAAVGRSPRQ